MVSRENAVIVASIALALLVGYGVFEYTTVSDWVAMAVFLVLGVVVPTLVNEYLDRQ